MKTKNIFKVLALAMLMPATMLTTACSSEDDALNNTANTENTINKGYALPVTVNVTREGDAGTRATYNESTRKLEFSAGDKLFVSGYYGGLDKRFAGTLEYDTESGKFSGTIYTQDDTYSTYEALFAASASEKISATLLPAGYIDHGYLVIKTNDTDAQYDDYIEGSSEYTLATSKADGVAQFSYEQADSYSDGFALSPDNAILNFTITGLAASTSVNVSLTSIEYNITGTVTTDASGNAKFAAGIMDEFNLQPFSLTVGGNPITIVSSDKLVEAGKIYNITRAVTPPTLAQTMTTAGMTVKVKYNYHNEVNYCLFSSNGDDTYTFQSGDGWAGSKEECAKALVVEGGKLVFKQNVFDAIDDQWSKYGFSVTFDTSNNTYSQWVGKDAQDMFNPYFISVEVNSVPIALTKKIFVSDLVKEQGQRWSDIIANNSDKIKADDYFGYVVRISDGAKLQYNPFDEDWQDVYANDDYQTRGTYKFEGD